MFGAAGMSVGQLLGSLLRGICLVITLHRGLVTCYIIGDVFTYILCVCSFWYVVCTV